jgi:hypothetical protein
LRLLVLLRHHAKALLLGFAFRCGHRRAILFQIGLQFDALLLHHLQLLLAGRKLLFQLLDRLLRHRRLAFDARDIDIADLQ